MYELSKKLLEKGHEVEICAFGNATLAYKKGNVRINRFSTVDVPLIRVLDLSRKISRYLENGDFDIYHVHTAPLAFFLDKKPLVVTAHTTIFGEGKSIEVSSGGSLFDVVSSFYYKEMRFLDKRAYQKAKVVIAVNDNIKDELERVYNTSKKKIATIYNGVNTKIFYAVKNKGRTKEEIGLDPQDFVVLYVGRLEARKNVGLLIDAMRLLRKESMVTLIVGKGSKEDSLKRMSNHLGLGTSLKFVRYVKDSDLLKIYNAADIFVLPSVYEGMPLSMLEAMACGVPTIATNFPGVENIIRNGENGIILEKTSAECLAEKIGYLYRESKVRGNMSMKAIQLINEKFSLEVAVKKTIDVYDQIK
jgi:glycosyltransferase involved in cell wall biosynthesis